MTDPFEPVALDAHAAHHRIDQLAAVLVDAVDSGASVSFMAPFRHAEAVAYWQGVVAAVAAGRVVLLVAPAAGRVDGTVQLHLATPPNQAHRAEIAKLLVHRRARGRGIARRLMAAAERQALARGRTLLTLDTLVGGGADRLYQRLGWTRAGVIPRYARLPHGPLGDTVIFYKELG